MRIISAPGNQKVFRQIRTIPQRFYNGIREGNFAIGSTLQKDIRRTMTEGKKKGRIYKIRGRRHQASAPGEAPAVFTGALRGSVGFVVGTRELKFGARAFYAGWLEEGTKKMKKRLYLKNAYFRNRRNAEVYYYKRITTRLLRI